MTNPGITFISSSYLALFGVSRYQHATDPVLGCLHDELNIHLAILDFRPIYCCQPLSVLQTSSVTAQMSPSAEPKHNTGTELQRCAVFGPVNGP